MRADGLAPSRVANVVQVLSLMLELAVREGAVVADPVARAQYRARAAPPSPPCRRNRWTASSRMPPVPRTPLCGARWRSPVYASAKRSGWPITTSIQTTVDQYGNLVPGDVKAADLIRTTLDRAFRAGA
jgi:hypothetical protein